MGSLHQHGGGGRLSLILGGYGLFFGLCLLFWAFFLKRAPRLLLMLASITGVYLACIALAGLNHIGAGSLPLLAVWIILLGVGVFAESSFAPAARARSSSSVYLFFLSSHAVRSANMDSL